MEDNNKGLLNGPSYTPLPAPWQVKQIPGGFKVLDASDQALVYIYACEMP